MGASTLGEYRRGSERRICNQGGTAESPNGSTTQYINKTAQSKGSTATQGNFLKATVAALAKTYQFQSPDLWQIIPPGQTPYDEYAAHLRIAANKAAY